MEKKNKTNIVGRVAFALCMLGFIGWFLPFVGWPISIEAPNTEPHGIAIDSQDNIYCGSKMYGRIQKYRPDGEFVRAFNIHGGTGRGSDFGFYLNEKGNLCILISGRAKSGGSYFELTQYDANGTVLSAKEYTKDSTDYSYAVQNSAIDKGGKRYLFKGFIFPRVVKHVNGDYSTIIRTPILLWSLQAPFPAFAFFFVSMMVLIVLRFKAEANQIGIRTLNYVLRTDKLPSRRKVLRIVFTILGIVAVLLVLIPLALAHYPELFIFAFLSLWVSGVMFWFMGMIIMAINVWREKKLQISSFARLGAGTSLKERYEQSLVDATRLSKDPVVAKTGRISNRIVKVWLWTWLTLIVLATCVVLYLDHIGVWKTILHK